MKASELRLGNFFLPGNHVHSHEAAIVHSIEDGLIRFKAINALGQEYIALDQGNDFEGIPLTEEWLLKFGFEDISDDNFNQWQKETRAKPIFELIKRYSREHFEVYSYKQLGIETLYVHQLQNLYFALTGEELKIKSPDSV